MRLISTSVLSSLILGLAATAQIPEEIKSAPAAEAYPEADGVVLAEEVEIVLDREGKVSRRHRRLTKIFREHVLSSGRADPRIPFDAVDQTLTVSRCRTWMRDGTPVDTDPGNGFVEVTPFALEHAVDYTRIREMVLVHTGVEQGATLELDYTIADKAPRGRPFWGEIVLQSELPVLQQTVVIRVPEGASVFIQAIHAEVTPKKTTSDGVDTYLVKRLAVPPVNLDECAGHVREVVARLVYSSLPSWAEVGTLLDKSISRAVDSSDAIRNRVKALTVGVGTRLERAYRIHDFVATRVRTVNWAPDDFGFVPRSASSVHASAYGHDLDKAVLLKAMLKEAGISASVVLASTTTSLAMRAPSPTQLSDVWVMVENGHRRVWLDPSVSLDRRSGRDLEGRAILKLAGRGSTVTRVPVSEPGANAAVMTGICRLGAEGRVEGRLRLDLSGSLNPYHRLRGGVGPLEAFASRVASGLGGARATKHELSHFDEILSSISVTARGGALTRKDTETLELTLPALPDPIASRGYQIHRGRRTTPLFLEGLASERIEIEIRLPPGLRVAYRPAPVTVDNAVGRLLISLEPAEGGLTYKRAFTLKKSVIPPDEYLAFRKLITSQRARRNTILLLERPEG
jgi:hypothetical protein